jgi:hypothetical protein
VRASDQLLARLAGEIEEQQSFQDRLLEGAEKENRDLSDNEMGSSPEPRQAAGAEQTARARQRVTADRRIRRR